MTPGEAPPERPAWSRGCRAWGQAQGVEEPILGLLDAFAARRPAEGGASSRWLRAAADDLPTLEAEGAAAASSLAESIVTRVGPQTQPGHAQDLARRFMALLDGLRTLGRPEARVLRVGLLARMSEVLDEPERRRSRVRDLIDFYYGYGSVLRHRTPGLPTVTERIRRTLRWRGVGPGLEHARVEGPTTMGPMHANLLRARAVRLHVVHRRQATGSFDRLVREAGALAGVSGGYILSSEMDIETPSEAGDPVGLLVQEGRVVNPPLFRRACLIDRPEGLDVDVVGPTDLVVAVTGGAWTIRACDDPAAMPEVPVAFRRGFGARCPPHRGWSLAVLGTRVIAAGPGALAIPKAGMVLTVPEHLVPPQAAPRPGATVEYRLDRPAWSAVAAGPMLVPAFEGDRSLAAEDFTTAVPPYTFAADETGGRNLLPRMLAGLTDDGALLFVAIDGRDFHRAVGMSLRQCADVLQQLGCARGLNLDGGDSKRMVVDGRVVDLPGRQLEWAAPTPRPGAGPAWSAARPVHCAILLRPR